MKNIIKNLVKKYFKLYDEQDFDNAAVNTGDAKDRDDFIWKMKNKLFRSKS